MARVSVLQAAGRHAREPHGTRFDLADECRAFGIDAVAMETLVNGATLLAGIALQSAPRSSLPVAKIGD